MIRSVPATAMLARLMWEIAQSAINTATICHRTALGFSREGEDKEFARGSKAGFTPRP
jgi:hypothetical protein